MGMKKLIGLPQQGRDVTLQALSDTYAKRQQDYLTFVMLLHAMILRVVAEEKKRRELLEKAYLFGNRSRALPVPTQLPYACIGEGRTLDIRELPRKYCGGDSLNLVQIWIFLKNLIVAPSGAEGIGVSWLELFAKFDKEGGVLDRDTSVVFARKLPSSKQAIALFIKTVRFVVSLCMSPSEAMLFTACRSNLLRLLPAGINSFTPCVNFLPCWGNAAAQGVMLRILAYSTRITHNTKQMLHQGALFLKAHKLSLRGSIIWRRWNDITDFVPRKVARFLKEVHDNASGPDASELIYQTRPRYFWVKCAHCDFWRNVSHIPMTRNICGIP